MRHTSNLPRRSAVPLALAAVAGGALPSATAADTTHASCIAPDVVGVSLAMARGALRASGCAVQLRQLPGHGEYVTPEGADSRQIVARQRPPSGSRTPAVTVWLKPLCRQPALPGPERTGPVSSSGPTELIAGLFLRGGPARTDPHCRRGRPAEGTLTVTTAAGMPVARRVVRDGRFGVFPLKPGRYLLSGSPNSAPGTTQQPAPHAVTISAGRSTRLNLVDEVR